MFFKSKKKFYAIILSALMAFTFISPSLVQASELSSMEDTNQISLNDFELTEQELKDAEIISKYLSFDYEKGIPIFNQAQAESDNVEERILIEGQSYNQDMNKLLESELESPNNEISTYKGSNYFTVMGNNWYRVGLSSFVCKTLSSGLANGASWVVTTLIALIPVIGPYAAVVGKVLIKLGTSVLKRYTKSGIVVEMKKNIFNPGWDVNYWQQ